MSYGYVTLSVHTFFGTENARTCKEVYTTGMFRCGPVRVRVLFVLVRVAPTGTNFYFSCRVRSEFQNKSGPVFYAWSVSFPRSGPGLVLTAHVWFIKTFSWL